MKLYKDIGLYKIFYIKEYEKNKNEYIKWFEYNFIPKYYNDDIINNVDFKFLYHFIYGIKSYLNRFYPERIDFNEYIFNNMFNLTVLHKDKLINKKFYTFILRNNITIDNIINTSNIWINLPGILTLCNKTLDDIYKIKPNKHITIKSINNKVYNYSLYGLTFYNSDKNAEHVITVIKDLNNKIDNYYIFDNDLYTNYPLELNVNKNKILSDDLFYDKQFKDKNEPFKGGQQYQQLYKQQQQDISIHQQDKKKNYIINYGIKNMDNITKEDEDNYLSFIYYTDFGEGTIKHYFTTYKSEIIMYIRDDFIPKFKKIKKIYNLKYQQDFKT